ncbi:MAG TPA: hypothetical protein VGH84_13945, partial [Steroidobacteraceae bacterium]
MAYSFGDGFDLYATAADAFAGFWDSGAGAPTFVAGRFTGSQALHVTATSVSLTKNSSVNDAVHHLVVAFRQTAAITGSTLGLYLQLLDGVAGQCCVVFRSDGAILLTSGTPAGTALATYTGAFPAVNTWYAFEMEVVINNATGSFTVRKNGNTSNDFTLGSLNTRTSANNYANKLTLGMQAAVNAQEVDDLFWRSDASAVAWMGDIRCYTRMPASDASVQFARSSSSYTQTPGVSGGTDAVSATIAYYTPIVPQVDGTLGSATISLTAGYTGNLKCTLFNGTSTTITTVITSATTLNNPTTGTNTITFPSPPSLLRGGTYWLGVISDTASGTFVGTNLTIGKSSSTSYAAFPVANPSTPGGNSVPFTTFTITATNNSSLVSDPQQDATTTYVYDSNPGHADLYGIGNIASTPATTF